MSEKRGVPSALSGHAPPFVWLQASDSTSSPRCHAPGQPCARENRTIVGTQKRLAHTPALPRDKMHTALKTVRECAQTSSTREDLCLNDNISLVCTAKQARQARSRREGLKERKRRTVRGQY